MGFFLNNIYSIWKLHFWRFPEMFCHQQKVVDHQSGQAKNENSLFDVFLIFLIFFQKIIFLSWNDIFAIRNSILRKYSLWKLHFWGFPEMFCHQKKVVDHQSGQAKNENFSFGSIFDFFQICSKFSFFELKWYFCDQKFNITKVLSLKTPFLRLCRDPKKSGEY